MSETIEWSLDIPWFAWIYHFPVRSTLRRKPTDRRTDGRQPWWAPPDRLDSRTSAVIGLLAVAAVIFGYINTLFTQTVTYASEEFGVSSGSKGLAGTIVRLGIVLVMPLMFAADRVGRRRVVRIAALGGIGCCALGALAPSFWLLTASQSIGRPLGLTLDVLVAVIAAEEMPRNSRAYAISILAMASGLGAGFAVMALPLADLGARGWRFVYLVPLLLLIPANSLITKLPETRRFARPHAIEPPISRRRFSIIASVAFFTNLFVAPASFFQNDYLRLTRGYSAKLVSLFILATSTPAGIGLMVGGKIADMRGRRIVAGVALVAGSVFALLSFTIGGPMMWVAAFAGGALGGAGYPAIAVYRTELFPTGNRSRVGGLVTASALASGSIGLLITGAAVDRGVAYGTVLGFLAIGALVAATIVFLTYPETAHTELEQLNPEDEI